MADQYTPLPVKTKTDGDVVVNINTGTVAKLTNLAAGTITRIEGGSIVVTAGTIGDLDTVGTVGVLNAGSVVVTAGTISTLNTVGTVGVLNAGSVVVTAGTIGDLDTVGTVGVLNNGTLSLVKAGTVTLLESGTLAAVNNIVKGTITRLEGGSVVVTAGTISAGTITVSNFPGASDPKHSYQFATAIAAGANGTLAFGTITNAKTGQLAKMILSSSVPIRTQVDTRSGTTVVTKGVMFTSAASLIAKYDPPFDTYITLAGNGTDTNFQAIITNNDNALAADIYGVAFWDEV